MNRFRFSEFFYFANERPPLEYWALSPGMLFGASDKWWPDFGARGEPHPGLDLCAFVNRLDKLIWLDAQSRVPTLARGTVVAIMEDFLGSSIVVEHHQEDDGQSRLCSFYAHTIPYSDIEIGRTVTEGEVIATIADTARSKSGIRPHLHLSLGRTIDEVSYSEWDWKTLNRVEALELFDPLPRLDLPYRIGSNLYDSM